MSPHFIDDTYSQQSSTERAIIRIPILKRRIDAYIWSRVNKEEIDSNKLQPFLLSKLDGVPMPPLLPPVPSAKVIDCKIHPSRWFFE
jgi:hypothetical protein